MVCAHPSSILALRSLPDGPYHAFWQYVDSICSGRGVAVPLTDIWPESCPQVHLALHQSRYLLRDMGPDFSGVK